MQFCLLKLFCEKKKLNISSGKSLFYLDFLNFLSDSTKVFFSTPVTILWAGEYNEARP